MSPDEPPSLEDPPIPGGYRQGEQPVDMDKAIEYYHRSINWQRKEVGMIFMWPLSPDIKTKYAVLAVMTKKKELTPVEIMLLLKSLECDRSPAAIRTALKRLLKFGLATKERCWEGRRRGRTAYRLTEEGYLLANRAER